MASGGELGPRRSLLVVSHLSSFYEAPSGPPDPAEFEAEAPAPAAAAAAPEAAESARLLSTSTRASGRSRSRSRRLRPSLWRWLLWAGALLLTLGTAGLAAVHLTPRRPALVPAPDAGGRGFVRAPANAAWNRRLEVAGFAALGVFGLGGFLAAAGLLLPSVAGRLFDASDDGEGDDGDGEGEGDGDDDADSTVALAPPQPTASVRAVQPPRLPEGRVSGGAVRGSRRN